jgi:hypothetical protein
MRADETGDTNFIVFAILRAETYTITKKTEIKM